MVGYVTTTLVNNIIASYTTGITVTTPSASHLSADHNLFWNAQALLADPALDGSYHLTAGDAGDLYVSTFDPSAAPPHGYDNNTIWKITPDGSRTLFTRVEATELAFLPNGDLLVTGPVAGKSGVLRVAANGSVTPFASGFLSAVGLAFDLSGDLYVSDD